MATLSTASVMSEERRLYTAAGVALVVELALLGLGWAMLGHKSATPPPERPPTLLSLTSAPAPHPAAPTPAPPTPKPPPPVPQPHRTEPVHRAAHAAPPRPVTEPPRPTPAPSAAPLPAPSPATAPTDAAPPPAPAPAPAPTPAPAGPSPDFASKVRAAIQAALHYPESARMAGISGRTRVAFQYRDGAVSGETVVVSSGVALLDRAALAAVRDADYPRPEPAFAGKTLTEQLWVNFNLDDHE
ncbi:TonB family protein [Paraburkholderia acidipaludis]|uniref:TonB family protein n=1 Tax=Paraburkholderia acidipaludis TaxID=660537 RepID=UPI0009FC0CE0|nr:TonB family protein [Paraburkholderia acidipaludis]